MKRKGIVLLELVIVVAILIIVISIAIPLTGKLRGISRSRGCQENLKALGQAMSSYASDYKDNYPRAGGPNCYWAGYLGWKYEKDLPPYKLPEYDGKPLAVRITSSWYLLIRYEELLPSQFICDSSKDEAFSYSSPYRHYRQLWDFGDKPYKCVSYSLQSPYGQHPASPFDRVEKPIAADKSPWFDDEGQILSSATNNSQNHNGNGQNILFGDLHVGFSKSSYAGIGDDGIYTYSQDDTPPVERNEQTDAQTADDSFLVM